MRRLTIAVSLLVTIVTLAACGDDDEAPRPPDYDSALAGAPPRLAALHEQANELLGGGLEAFQARLADLRGYPVVVNKWASWCGPCRVEFPFFQRQAARVGDRVAFLGIDSDDHPDAARTFLEEYPVPYPSFSDADKDIADEVTDNNPGFPATAFYDSDGNRAYLHVGGYASKEDLAADIERYAR